MATLVEIENCEYEQFELIRKQMHERNRFGVSSESYHGKDKLAKFWFHDVKYIPLWMYRTKDITVYVPKEFLQDIIDPLLETFNE